MATLQVRDMSADDEYFVSTCSHINESDEIDACGRGRLTWMRQMQGHGLRAKAALLDGEHVGFVYAMPIEASPWGPIGSDLIVIPCLWVLPKAQGQGVGRALVAEAEEAARSQHTKGIVTTGFYHDFWFMPAPFFEKNGYVPVQRRDKAAIMLKRFDQSADAPAFLEPHYTFEAVPGKVVVDLFWNTLCQTSWVEAQRVKQVAEGFGDTVVLNEYCADEHEVLLRHQTPRGIFINGKEISWGYEAPKEGISEAIVKAQGQL